MGRACTICTHSDRDAIDAAIVSTASYRSTARRYGVTPDAIARHARAHVSAAVVAIADAAEADRRLTTSERVEGLYRRVERILDAAEQAGQASLSLAAARELRSTSELLARLSGELRPDAPTVSVNLLTSPDLQVLLAAINRALAGYPDARAAVARELGVLEAGGAPPRLAGGDL